MRIRCNSHFKGEIPNFEKAQKEKFCPAVSGSMQNRPEKLIGGLRARAGAISGMICAARANRAGENRTDQAAPDRDALNGTKCNTFQGRFISSVSGRVQSILGAFRGQ